MSSLDHARLALTRSSTCVAAHLYLTFNAIPISIDTVQVLSMELPALGLVVKREYMVNCQLQRLNDPVDKGHIEGRLGQICTFLKLLLQIESFSLRSN